MECVLDIELFDIFRDVLLIFQSIKSLVDWGDIFATVHGVDFRAESLELFLALDCHLQVALFGLDFLDVLVLVF